MNSAHPLRVVVALSVVVVFGTSGFAAEPNQPAALIYERDVKPLLVEFCFDCHGNGETAGGLDLDQFDTPDDRMSDPDLWWRVIKNLRAGVMPPNDYQELPTEAERKITEWIKFGPFGIDPKNPDPGPVTVRRLNRQEYGNTIRSLMGVRFDEKLLFPPDDSGHGFDNVADALMVSPLLLEKYLRAAEMVVDRAVPKVTKIVPRQDLDGRDFRSDDKNEAGNRLDGKKSAVVSKRIEVAEPGNYTVQVVTKQHGSFEFDPARYQVVCEVDGEPWISVEFGWDENKKTEFEQLFDWKSGEHDFVFKVTPITPDSEDAELMEDDDTNVSFEIDRVTIQGPQGTDRRVHPENYERFFHRDAPPDEAEERKRYAAEIFQSFATRAFRGQVEPATVDRLVTIAESIYSQPDKTFEEGIARGFVAILASPRFLFRIESVQAASADQPFAPVDELSLASRLSYFLWSSMPDEELVQLAEAGKLRSQLSQQVDRMLADEKADAFIANFVGQWLRTRDVPQIAVDPAVVLGVSDELDELREWFFARFRRGGRRRGFGDFSEEEQAKMNRFRELRGIIGRVDNDLKRAMRKETEQFVEHVMQADVSMLDLIDCNYTFLNEKLAEHYGIEGVEGDRMRRVELPDDSPRGGVLTQASMLLVTSNPTRTSPVKRGLFILDNLLGTPAPPAPAVVPELEESADRFGDRKPTLRELLSVHRESDLCASCHARMDPLGLALENFDALGMWRDTDHGVPIEPQGELVTGESFDDIISLKKLLREHHADDFYRCVTEKLLVFAIGRGIEYSDEHSVDLIVDELKASGGRFHTLVHEIVKSAPFQKQRVADHDDSKKVAQRKSRS